jgi:hypothetical protein
MRMAYSDELPTSRLSPSLQTLKRGELTLLQICSSRRAPATQKRFFSYVSRSRSLFGSCHNHCQYISQGSESAPSQGGVFALRANEKYVKQMTNILSVRSRSWCFYSCFMGAMYHSHVAFIQLLHSTYASHTLRRSKSLPMACHAPPP